MSKELEAFGRLALHTEYYNVVHDNINSENDYQVVKQALLKAQEQEKVLKIIKEKNVDIFRFRKLDFNTFNQLQRSCKLPELTQEEFDLVKEMMNNG